MKIALLGNPNTGKSSIFNLLTGLRQHVGNFPGVTVDKKLGNIKLDNENHQIIDFPGTYSIYPHSEDERVVYDVLSNPQHSDFPDACVVVLDASNLRRNLFLFSQIYDLMLPTVLVLNMIDVADKEQIIINKEALQQLFPDVYIVESNARVKLGKERLVNAILNVPNRLENSCFLENATLATINDKTQQEIEAEQRFAKIDEVFSEIVQKKEVKKQETTKSTKIDKVLTHPILGYLIFGGILMTIFQFIFSFASIPMDFIEEQFDSLSNYVSNTLPEGLFNDLISNGVIPGIGGVVMFVPQISILFFFLAILEETGYMARAVFIMDRLMRPFGLNGKSVVPLISGVACAIPGVMAARTIPDWKERITTIFVTPLMSCSARIPVYTLLITLVIPNQKIGWFNLQGLTLFGLYLLGVLAALGVAFVFKFIIQPKKKGYLLLEMPAYKPPRWGNVGITVFEKVKVFVLNAGKIILAISIILWAMASFGPKERLEKAQLTAQEYAIENQLSEDEVEDLMSSVELENSYIGILGKTIEPVIQPLGYDWKMGIALITSFAAREVFVGSLATIYSVHENEDDEDNLSLKQKLQNEKRADGTPTYNLASGVSLMVFYVFAMQCMATMAIVRRETGGWKWALIQLILFGIMAYGFAFITYNILS